MKRRLFTKTLLGGTSTAIVAGLYSWQIEPFWVEFVHKKLPVKNLPAHLLGRTLIQISDIHIGNRFNWNYIVETFEKVQQLNPDIVVYTGDYVHYEDATQYDQLKQVLKSAVKGRLGTIAILGNHDYGIGWREIEVAENITDLLSSAGIDVLRNQSRDVDGLNLIGFDDYWSPNFDAENAMSDFDPLRANVVLCHNPDVCDLPIWKDYKGWILAGHTHGGQCKPPFLNPPILPVKNKKYTAGKIDLSDGRMLYINRALGHMYQVRFNVRPEVTVFQLQSEA